MTSLDDLGDTPMPTVTRITIATEGQQLPGTLTTLDKGKVEAPSSGYA